jgi:hypothetical protein
MKISANKTLHLTAKSAAPIVALLLSAGERCRYTPEDLKVGAAVQNQNAGGVGKGR